jgi:hypothetical protein
MPTRIVFDDCEDLVVADSQDDVVAAVRRDYPNPVKLRRDDAGSELHVNWDHILLIEPAGD